MISMTTRGGSAPSLGTRGPAFAFIQKCLSIQQGAGPRSAIERFFGMSPLVPDARAWYQDALSEIEVAQSLERMGDDWTVLHAIPAGSKGLDIDHLVIGPAGVFTVTTKAHAGQRVYAGGHIFQVGGSRKHYLRDAELAAARASRLLSSVVGEQVPVTPLIVVTGASSLTLAERPAVDVLAPTHVGHWLRKHRGALADEAVTRIALAATQQSTWQSDAEIVTEARVNTQLFERLRREVDAASARARLWATGGTISLLLALTAFFVKVLPVLMTESLVH